MYIKKVRKNNGSSKKSYEYYHLVESIRTEKGPRQKLILNLGQLDIDPSQFKSLAKRIEDILTGNQSFFELDKNIEKIASLASKKIFVKQAQENENTNNNDFQNIDINSITPECSRTIGPEYVCNSVWNELELDNFFKNNGIKHSTLSVFKSIIFGRLIEPASERHTFNWANNQSSILEIAGLPTQVNLTSFYRANDTLFSLKEKLEKHISETEKNMFALSEKYCLIDLTNSYFEGTCKFNTKAKFGKSKEHRSDCRLITLGLIIDEMGFAKSSNLYSGNTADSTTLANMLIDLEKKSSSKNNKKTVIIDAGIATKDNIEYLKNNNYNYIVINRGNVPFDYDFENMKTIKKDAKSNIEIKIKKYNFEKDTYVLCKSKKKELKEKSMHERVETNLLDRLNYYKSGLNKKNRAKSFEKIIELIGRLKEKYSKVAKLYNIEIKSNDDKSKVLDIVWNKKEQYEIEREREGSYILRTDRTDLSEEEIWNMYIILRRIEYSFLCMKSHLGLRPNFHQKEQRVDAHMFISVIAYHILHIIEYKLRQVNDHRKWSTIRNILKSHQRLTITFNKKCIDGSILKQLIRVNTRVEEAHADIYMKLKLNGNPLPRKIMLNSG
jgi:transposase